MIENNHIFASTFCVTLSPGLSFQVATDRLLPAEGVNACACACVWFVSIASPSRRFGRSGRGEREGGRGEGRGRRTREAVGGGPVGSAVTCTLKALILIFGESVSPR